MATSLYDFRRSFLFHRMPLRHVTVQDIKPALNTHCFDTFADNKRLYPETAASEFYVLNHLVAELGLKHHIYERLSSKQQDLLDLYKEVVASQSKAMFTYLILICTRETRHAKDKNSMFYQLSETTPKAMEFLKYIKGCGSSEAVTRFFKEALPVDLIEYCEFMRKVFYEAAWNGGYGGSAWGSIADVLLAYAKGDMSCEMLLDQAYHLAHNNGAIFNKGIVFNMYTGDLKKVLDCQRTGYLPNLVHHTNQAGSTADLNSLLSSARKILAAYHEDLASITPVDWEDVMAKGATSSYSHLVEKQKKVAEAIPVDVPEGFTYTGKTVIIHAAATAKVLEKIR